MPSIKLYCGIDPEPGGAISAIWFNDTSQKIEDICIFDTPGLDVVERRRVLAEQLLDKEAITKNGSLTRLFTPLRYAFIEKVWVFPGMHAIAMSKLVESFGIWQGLLIAYGFEIHMEPPKQWKGYYSLTSDKSLSVEVVRNNFSNRVISKYMQGGVNKIHNRAESLLMAAYHMLQKAPYASKAIKEYV